MDKPMTVPIMNSRFSLFGLIVLWFLFLISCATLQPGPSPVYVKRDAFGFAHAGERPEDYPFLKKTGAEWIRQTFRWDVVNPSREVWRFDRFDRLMDIADENRIKVIAVLAYDVGWIHPGGKARRRISADQLPFYLEYVEKVVERYRGRVDAWEIWNEPNVTFWKGPNRDFFHLAWETAVLVKRLDPDTPLLVGATFRVPDRFIRALHENGTLGIADALSIHPYGINPGDTARQIAKAKRLLTELAPDRELWITEIGYPTRGVYPSRVASKKLPNRVIRTLTAATSQGVGVTVWFRHFDSASEEDRRIVFDSASYFGLAGEDGELKDGGRAFAVFTEHTRGSIYDPGILEIDGSLKSALSAAAYVKDMGDEVFLVFRLLRGGVRKITVRSSGAGLRSVKLLTGVKGEQVESWSGRVTSEPMFLLCEGYEGGSIRITDTSASQP